MLSLGCYGRAANAFYQVAGILGIAKKNNLEPVFPLLINHCARDQFGSTEDAEMYKYFVHQLPPIPEGIQWQPEISIPWGYSDVRLSPGNWNLSGHFQAPKYFADCRDQVSHYFRMKEEPPQNDYTAIHYRAGDYQEGTNNYHPRMTMDYYAPAMNRVGGPYLVFSDDIAEAKKLFGSSIEYSEGKDYIQDWKLMKRCKSFIVANSSYSAMAAMLGEHPDKVVIAPRPWFGKAASITGEDIYSPDWMVINWA